MNVFLRAICSIIILCSFSFFGESVYSHGREAKIPDINDWEDKGIALSKGRPGSWDVRLTGMINPCTVIKKNGTYLLYYLGASGDRTTDGGPAFRALGVATSPDGIKFVKYSRNPILKHIPHNNQEEGIFSAGSSLDENGNIALHYGAMWAANSTTGSVQSHITLATSVDGFNFIDKGYIVRWDDANVWGYGDELFPVGSVRANNTWYVYYIAKGIDVPKWSLGLASGPTADNLPTTQAVVSKLNYFNSGGDPILMGNDRLALFIETYDPRYKLEIRTASLATPAQLSDSVETYDFGTNKYDQTVFMDAVLGKWFMYYTSADGDSIRVKTAPAMYIAEPTHRMASERR